MGIRVIETDLSGVLLIETDYFRDERGFFIESYHRRRYVEHGIDCEFVQDNHSRSAAGVLRGIHYQDTSAPMDKLVRCTAGAILDVAVDLRVSSPTFGRWVAVELSAENMRQLLVPVGFGHAFLTLSQFAEVQYRCSGYYTPSAEGNIRWDDPDLAIEWPVREPQLSNRDRHAPSLKDYLQHPAFP
ncbi:MAG TPA: dTDP-4-dehydrorhamnose 3,5-epimerase [Roseiflexaceae bacterium]|nr:dTDP-4-dehydrorhamnose 3,5-epimerase [Roseiflexaceae bacterium]HMP40887.1 dTDP-4-dehydrorhamnose 3,5-epimerase [Roseiflexaceae bacterium]